MSRILHIFRNTPLGRETILQSFDLCARFGFSLAVYVPKEVRFLMYFENDAIQMDLDRSYLTAPDSAEEHVSDLAKDYNIEMNFLKPKDFTTEALPNIPTEFDLMCCPRSVSDRASKIGLGHIGPRVRRIIQRATFPVFIPSTVYKRWNSLAVLFGGSSNAINALRLAFKISQLVNLPIDLFTYKEGNRGRKNLEQLIDAEGLSAVLKSRVRKWHFFKENSIEEGLYNVPHDALVLLGAYGHSAIKEVLFGSTMEIIQETMTNNFLVVGPCCEVGRFGRSLTKTAY